MGLFGCNHYWKVEKRSNVIQLDDMGYPLRLFIVRCSQCGKSDQHWIDISTKELEELKTGKSVLLEWK